MKRISCLCVIVVFLFACQESGGKFKKFSKDVEYQYIQFGEGELIKGNTTLLASLAVLNELKDTLHYVPNYPYLFNINGHLLDSLWLTLNIGDSLNIKMKRSVLNSYIQLYKPMFSDTGNVYLHIRLKESIENNKSEQRVKELISLKELKDYERFSKFIDNQNDSLEYIDGVYRIIKERTNGVPLHYGDELTISYTGKFLNGYIFDSTNDKGVTPTFTFGKELQLLDGIQKGLIGLREGERVKIILPSRHAFGEKGSLAGIVPPHTSVIFDIKILKVNS